jgi:hypothetical protein
MMTTAAGTITPARVLVIGAGVAGCRPLPPRSRLGAVVSAYDLRRRRQGAGAEPRRTLCRAPHRSQGRAGCPRLRAKPRTRISTPASANCWVPGGGRKRRRDHRRRYPGKEIARAGHEKWCGNGTRFGNCRSGRRARRQLRADQARGKNRHSSSASPSSVLPSTLPAPYPATRARCMRAILPRFCLHDEGRKAAAQSGTTKSSKALWSRAAAKS